MDKKDKVKTINQAINRSPVAKEKGAKAELLPNDRIEYSMSATTRLGKPYRIKVTFRQILSLLHGEDIRQLHRLFGK